MVYYQLAKQSKTMMKAIIIDDEPAGRDFLADLLKEYCNNITVAGEGKNVKEGIKCIDKIRPDLVFLDIHMPDGIGFDVLEGVKYKDFAVIFVTAFDKYAVRAFRFSAIDYLLKPIDPDLLKQAVKKAEDSTNREQLNKMLEGFLNHYRGAKGNGNKLVLRTSDKVHLLNISNIIRCQSDKNYTEFHFLGHQPVVVSKTLKEYQDLLEDHNFIRVHQSHLINPDYIDHFDRYDAKVYMADGSEIPVATRRKDELMTLFREIGKR